MFQVLSTTGGDWHQEATFSDYATACRYAAQLETRASTVRCVVRRVR